MKVSTPHFKLKRAVLVTGLVFGMTACNTDDLAPPPPPPLVNTAPEIVSTAGLSANEGQPYSYALVATDINADALTFSISGAAWLSIDTATGLVTGVPGSTDVGDNSVTVTVSDGTDTTSQTFVVGVIAALPNNVAPEYTSTPVEEGAVDEAYEYVVSATDGNFDDISFTFSGTLPAWATFTVDTDAGTATLSGTPDIADDYPVEITISDGVEDVVQSFTIAVFGPAIVTTELTVFENDALPEWAPWTDEKGPTEVVTVEGDPERDQAVQFTLTDATVAGFTARAGGGAVGGMPFDASGLLANGQITFELFLVQEPTVPVSNWFFKVEAGSFESAREVFLSSALEGHAAPELNTWQKYSFPLSTLASGSTLDPSGIDLFMVFPSFANAAGAVYLIDNFRIVSVVGGNSPGGGGDDGNGPELIANGDFSNGLVGWKSDIGEVIDEGGNSVFLATIEGTSQNVFDVNQSYVFDITEGETYVFSFRAKAAVERTIVAGLGLNGGDFTNISETVDLTTEWQTFTTEVVANGIGGVGSRVLFDMGVFAGNVFIDDVSVKVKDGGDVGGPAEGEQLTNGDFTDGLASWKPDVGAVVDDGGNNIFEATIDTATANVFDINQSQIFDITEGATYRFSFRAKASVERTMIAGLGLNGGDFTNISETIPLTTEWQTFTKDIVAVGIGGVGSRVLFDMGVGVGNINIDDVSVILLPAE